jgi:UDP-N-acetylmuramoyl-tripeptide--D-alanyl-D-alanine ligase
MLSAFPVFTWQELQSATQAALAQTEAIAAAFPEAVPLVTDSRQVKPGDFYIPLVGDRLDGHQFLEAAFQAGACGALAQTGKALPANAHHILWVPNTTISFLQLGRYHRQRLNPTVIGITGSSGKTTVKEMMYAALSPLFPTQCTQQNFNNDFGVAQTLLALQPSTRYHIVEMAMRGLGEIQRLTEHARPDIAIVNNVGPAHIERLGSLQAIAQAKTEIFKGLDPASGIAVINGDDELLVAETARVWPGQTVYFSLESVQGLKPASDGHGVSFQFKRHPVQLQVPGVHMVSNALAVLTVAELLALPLPDVIQGLSGYSGSSGRWERKPLRAFPNAWVIQDAYNANPASMLASLQTFLADRTGTRKALILGAMNELGTFSDEYHQSIAEWLSEQSGLAWVLLVGEPWKLFYKPCFQDARFEVEWVPSTEKAHGFLKAQDLTDTQLLVKGSRSYALETLLAETAA